MWAAACSAAAGLASLQTLGVEIVMQFARFMQEMALDEIDAIVTKMGQCLCVLHGDSDDLDAVTVCRDDDIPDDCDIFGIGIELMDQ